MSNGRYPLPTRFGLYMSLSSPAVSSSAPGSAHPSRVRSLMLLAACTVLAFGLAACGGGGGGGTSSPTQSDGGGSSSGSGGSSGGSGGGSGAGGSSGGSGDTPPPPTGSITISWTPPQARADGSPLTDLAGYHIYYGTASGVYSQTVTVASPSATSYTIANLSAGTYYVTMRSFDTSNIESSSSPEASKTIN